jgi:carboxypeptidase Taq
LRYEIEKRLIEGSLEVVGIADAWNEGMQELFGLTVESDADGPLQDVHWSAGMFGYFPTYALGNAYAAGLLASAQAEVPDLAACMGKGDFSPVLAWMRANVHVKGRYLPPWLLMSRAMKSAPGDKFVCFFDYLTKKFGALYGI